MYLTGIQSDLITNPKRFWSYVNFKRKTNGFPCAMSPNEKCAKGESEIAELFAELFSTSFQLSSTAQMPDYSSAPLNGFTIRKFTINEVQAALATLDVNKGSGPDFIPPIFLRNCAASIAPSLTDIFNESISTCAFPDLQIWLTRERSELPWHRNSTNHR